MASPGTGAKTLLMAALEQQIPNMQVGAPHLTAAANFGLVQMAVDPSAIFETSVSQIVPNELTGTLGNPIAIPGRRSYTLDWQMALRSASLVPVLSTFMGKPTKTQDGVADAYNYAFSPSDASADAVSLWGMLHKAGDTKPIIWRGARFGAIEMSATGTEEAKLKATGRGCGDTEHGIGISVVKTGTYAHAPILTGDRSDANRTTDALTLKVSDAPTLGTFTVVVKLGSGSYSTAKTTITYDVSTKEQTAWAEIVTDTGVAGFDECENRTPLLVWFPGDVTLMAAADTWELPALAVVPGDGSGESGAARTILTGCRFGPAHISLLKGPSTANTAFDCTQFSLKLNRTISENYTFGPNAVNPTDMDVTGYIGAEFDMTRRFDSREYERLMRTNDRVVVKVTFAGPVLTGSLSGWREQVVFDFAQMRVQDVKSAVPGPGIISETVKLVAEQPSSGAAAMTAAIRSAYSWDLAVL